MTVGTRHPYQAPTGISGCHRAVALGFPTEHHVSLPLTTVYWAPLSTGHLDWASVGSGHHQAPLGSGYHQALRTITNQWAMSTTGHPFMALGTTGHHWAVGTCHPYCALGFCTGHQAYPPWHRAPLLGTRHQWTAGSTRHQ